MVSRKAYKLSSSRIFGKEVLIPCNSALKASCGKSRSSCNGSAASTVRVKLSLPSSAMAQTSARISSTHSARYTPEGIFYDLLEPDTLGSKPTIVMIHGGGHEQLAAPGRVSEDDPRVPM